MHKLLNYKILTGPLIAILLWILPLQSLSPSAHLMSGIFAWVLMWWIFEPVPLPVTAIFGVILAVILNITDVNTAFAPFADPIIFLFLGSFLLAQAMTRHGLVQRIALKVLSSPKSEKEPRKALLKFIVLTIAISAFMPNTATMAIMMPIGMVLLQSLYPTEAHSKGSFLAALAYATAIGGVATPIGTPPNTLTVGIIDNLTGQHISFFGWTLAALPIVFALGIFNHFYTKQALKTEVAKFDFQSMRDDVKTLGALTTPEKHILIAMTLAIIFWMLPNLSYIFPSSVSALIANWVDRRIPESIAILLPVCFLFFVSDENGRPTLQWDDARAIDWGTLILFGGGLSLGALLFSTGLVQSVGNQIAHVFSQSPEWVFMASTTLFTLVLTQVTSNTATAAMIVPLIIAASRSLGFDPVIHGITVGIASSFGFMLPVATPPNMMAYSSGMLAPKLMLKRGFVTNVVTWIFLILNLVWLNLIRGFLT